MSKTCPHGVINEQHCSACFWYTLYLEMHDENVRLRARVEQFEQPEPDGSPAGWDVDTWKLTHRDTSTSSMSLEATGANEEQRTMEPTGPSKGKEPEASSDPVIDFTGLPVNWSHP